MMGYDRHLGWLVAAVAAVSVHAGAATVLLRQTPAPMPADPVVVDLVPAEAPPAPPSFEVPPSPLSPIEEPPEFPPEEPEPEPALEPEPLPVPPLPELPEMAEIAPLPDPLAIRPMVRPRIVELEPPPEPEPKREVKREPKKPAKTAERRREAPKTPASPVRTASTSTGQTVGAVSPQAAASWKNTAQATIARHMKRGRYGKRNMVVSVTVSVSASGQITGASLVSSSGDARTDAEVLRQLRRLTRLPTPPGPQTLTVPFKLQ